VIAAPQRDENYTPAFEDVQRAELDWIAQRRKVVGGIEPQAPIVGLALSGGGIRSATFNLGVLQSLSRKGLLSRIDYLSTVSGGGYIGSCLTWLRAHVPPGFPHHLGGIPLASGNGTVLDWLRAHGRYLITGRGLSGWSLAASILAGTLLNLFVLIPLFLFIVALASRDWFEFSWPATLHLPGAGPIPGHDGFIVFGVAGFVMLGLYLLTALLFALSTALPPLRRMTAEYYFRRKLGQLLAGGLIAIAIGALPVLTGIEETAGSYLRSDGAKEIVRHASWLVPLITGVFSTWSAKRSTGDSSAVAIVGLALLLYGGFTGLYHLVNHTSLMSTVGYDWWLLASVLLAMVCNINAVSMHSYYRSRLANAYLPEVAASEHAKDSHAMTFRLTDVSADSGTPFHLINTTLNTTSSHNEKLRSRNGENMILSPLYCGSQTTGYRRTSNYLNGEMTLSTAFSVSGAAVDPDMSATRARPISFLMTLLNVRLGFWTMNPKHEPRGLRWPAWYQLMLREMLGVGLSETQSRIHLADGGHFENLGIYELLRRRCRYIIVSDAGADPGTTLADLGQAMQRARADFGANIEICADGFYDERASSLRTRAHLFGRVTYADGSTGQILYLKALLHTQLSADVYAYWRTNPAFPDQATSNQFYGEMQFDSYRELGQQLMNSLIGDAASIEDLFKPDGRPA
jgi:hypothetical protein